MPKIKEDLAPVCRLPQGNPVEAICDYFQSLMENKLVRKPPLWDNAGRTSLQVRERAREEANIAEEKLQEGRLVFTKKRRQMDAKWESLRERQYKLKQTFIKFNKLLCENQNKRERAQDEIDRDQKLLDEKLEEIEKLTKDVAHMRQVCQDMEKFIDDHSMYEEYLMNVVSFEKDFRTPADILNRFESLTRTKLALSRRQEQCLSRIIELQAKSTKMMETRLQQLMSMNNTLADLKIRYGHAKNKTRKWEAILARVYKKTSQTQVELARVRDSLWDFYCTICKQKGMEPATVPEDYDTQLIYVFKAILELRSIVTATNKIMAKQLESNVVQSPMDV